ncbi:MAG: UDP-N-acetylmuramate dehydrogenase [Acidobacteria bacterium]|nr:UDP-N-acetylmuramate dehydrogenase [Acidobacteriota bacterium]
MAIEEKIEEGVPLAGFTTLGVGGPARNFLSARSEDDLPAAFRFAEERGLEVFVLGGGSNLVVSDAGFDGLVIKIDLHGVVFGQPDEVGFVLAEVAAGEDWDAFVAECVSRELAGIECMSGIPGSIGGTPVQNVGAYGQEVAETIVSVRCFDRKLAEFVLLGNEDCGFSYRRSIFNTSESGRYVVVSVTFRLKAGGGPKVVYRDLKEHFGERSPSLAEVRVAVLDIRRRKSMVIDPADPNSRSAGSFFKNPIVSVAVHRAIAQAEGMDVPSFSAGEGLVKVPAAWLIERAGFAKGYRLGEAGISANHSLAIVNLGRAKAADIFALMDELRSGVRSRFGIELVPEPVFLGTERVLPQSVSESVV